LDKVLEKDDIGTEQVLEIIYQQQAVFRVRAVTRCTRYNQPLIFLKKLFKLTTLIYCFFSQRKILNYCLQFYARPCRGCHLSKLQSRWSVFGEWIWRHDCSLLGRQHANSSPCLPGTQKLGALHCLGSEFQKAGISLQERDYFVVGSRKWQIHWKASHGTQAVGHIFGMGATPPVRRPSQCI
jgi:hypothetical protein